MDWFRWYNGATRDPKFGLIAKRVGTSAAEVIAVWAAVLEAASESDQRGNAGEIDFDSLDFLLGIPEGRSKSIYTEMIGKGLVNDDNRVSKWEKRQPKREDPSAYERVKAFRARKQDDTQGNAPTDDDTQVKRSETHETQVERKETLEEKREEESREGECEGGTGPPAATARSPSGSRLSLVAMPEDWAAWCRDHRPDLDPADTWQQFRDYWAGLAGAKARKVDWLATWRNWCRSQRTPPKAMATSAVRPKAEAMRSGAPNAREQFVYSLDKTGRQVAAI